MHLSEDTILALVAGQLDATRGSEAHAHADQCEQCRQLIVLAARDAAGQPTEGPPPRSEEQTLGDRPSTAPRKLQRGEEVQRYVILDRLASGGMGVVYAAYDPRLDRRVALKVLRGALDAGASSEMQLRLQREAQALARLAHPNVVAVHDVGTYQGLVFVAMEYVEGTTLGEWARASKRSWREVRDAYAQAARGLAAAHAVGLVHRDFKPENALLGTDGRVRVLDFGLARPDEAPPEPSQDPSGAVPLISTELTQDGSVLGTPAYMAPEQSRAERADARSDQFSFCVAMYEALYGTRPFASGSMRARLRAIERADLVPVQRGEVPAWLHEALLRGLAADPAARFPSMAALLTALHQDARPRRTAARAVAVVAGLAIATGAGFVIFREDLRCGGAGARVASSWNDGARSRIHAAFVATGQPYAEEAWGSVQLALDGWSSRWAERRVAVCKATVRGDQGELAGEVRTACLDRALLELDALEEVLSHADKSIVENAAKAARSLRDLKSCEDATALLARREEIPAAQRERVEALRRRLAAAQAQVRAGKFKEAAEAARAVVSEADELRQVHARAEALLELGTAEQLLADYANAENHLHGAATAGTSSGEDPVAAEAWLRLADLTGRELGRHEEGRRWVSYADAANRRGGSSPRLEGEGRRILGLIAMQQGHYDEATAENARALPLLEQALGPDDPAVAGILNSQGALLNLLGRTDEAIDQLQRALAVRRKVYGSRHPFTANTLANLATVYSDNGRDAEADEAQSEALRVFEAAYGADHPTTAGARLSLALFRARATRYTEAVALFEEAIPVLEQTLGKEHLKVGFALANLGGALVSKGELRAAVPYLERGLAVLEKAGGKDQPYLPMFASSLALARLETGAGGARALLEHAREQLDRAEHPSPYDSAYNGLLLARALVEGGERGERARVLVARARESAAQVRGQGDRAELDRIDQWLKGRGY